MVKKDLLSLNKMWNSIICNDNLYTLRQLVDEGYKFDAIITDPPYNIGKDFGNETDSQELDVFLDGIEDRLRLLKDLLYENGSIIWFCIHHYVGHIQVMMYNYFHYRRLMIWHYKNGMSRHMKEPVTEYEPFLWFSKSNTYAYNIDDLRVPYKSERVKNPCYKKNAKGEKIAWLPNPKGAKRGDIWECPVLSGKLYQDERTEHPTQKPEKLIMDLIKGFSPKKDGKYHGRILDPYAGVGTLGVACTKLNAFGHDLKWICIEMEQKWVDLGNDRIEKAKKESFVDIFNN